MHSDRAALDLVELDEVLVVARSMVPARHCPEDDVAEEVAPAVVEVPVPPEVGLDARQLPKLVVLPREARCCPASLEPEQTPAVASTKDTEPTAADRLELKRLLLCRWPKSQLHCQERQRSPRLRHQWRPRRRTPEWEAARAGMERGRGVLVERLALAVDRYGVQALLRQRVVHHARVQPVAVVLDLGERAERPARRTSRPARPSAHGRPPHLRIALATLPNVSAREHGCVNWHDSY